MAAYRNWLGLCKQTAELFQKDGKPLTRRLAADRSYTAPDGTALTLAGRSLMLIRNVGHLMIDQGVLDRDGQAAPEGVLDAAITSFVALHDLNGKSAFRNSRTGSHLYRQAEDARARRSGDSPTICSTASKTCWAATQHHQDRRHGRGAPHHGQPQGMHPRTRDRVVFINTGFLDRTGDEIHTSMEAGAMIRKGEMNDIQPGSRPMKTGMSTSACSAACPGTAQIGKGMWAMPDRMADMLKARRSPIRGRRHLRLGAVAHRGDAACAALSPGQRARRGSTIGVARRAPDCPTSSPFRWPDRPNWSPDEVQQELDNNAQGILGYVVRWIDQGVGCSKVPDIHDVGLMEDRATLRISSQHIANWLHSAASRKDAR